MLMSSSLFARAKLPLLPLLVSLLNPSSTLRFKAVEFYRRELVVAYGGRYYAYTFNLYLISGLFLEAVTLE